MPKRLLLLTGTVEATNLVPFLARQSEYCGVRAVSSLEELRAAMVDSVPDTRLLAFCTAVIVPQDILSALSGPSYNIHPGSPDYPGRHPESWAAYHGARRFGATLHEMANRVDEGAIIDVSWVDLPEGAGQMDVAVPAYKAALQLLVTWGGRLVGDDRPLPVSALRWSGRKTRRADLEAMCRVTSDIDAAEFERRRRSFAEAPGSRMTMNLHGRDFVHMVPGET